MIVRRFMGLRPVYSRPEEDASIGGVAETPTAETDAQAATEVDAPAEAAPTTMDAINAAIADVSAAVVPAAKPKEEATEAAPPPDQAAPVVPPVDAATAPAGPTDDELCAPLDGLKGRTKERFEQLTGRLKERTEELEANRAELAELKQSAPQAQQAIETLTEIHGAMQDAQVSGEEFAGFLTYAKAVRSGDFKAAAQTLIAQLRPLLPYVQGSLDVSGALDPLADFPDLQQAVAGHEITAAHAQELAAGRRIKFQQEEAHRQRQETQQSSQQQTQAQQQAKQGGLTALQTLETQLASSDADYARIAPELVKIIPQITQTYPPHLWASRVKEQYQLLKQYLPRQQTQVRAPSPPPIRPSGMGGGHGVPSKLSTGNIIDMVVSGELAG